MYKIMVIIHNEEGKSDVYYTDNGSEDLWTLLRNMESRKLATYKEDEVDLLELIQADKTCLYKVDRFVREGDLSVFQLWDY